MKSELETKSCACGSIAASAVKANDQACACGPDCACGTACDCGPESCSSSCNCAG